MKQQYKKLYFALGFVVLLIASFFIIKHFWPESKNKEETPPAAKTETIELTNFKKEDIKFIQIVNENANFKIERKDDTYELPEFQSEDPVSKDAADRVFTNLAHISSKKLIAEDSTELQQYNLEKPVSEITINCGNSEKNLLLGAQAPFSAGYYLKIKNENKVYLIAMTDAKAFLSTQKDYIEQKPDPEDKENQNADEQPDEDADIDAAN